MAPRVEWLWLTAFLLACTQAAGLDDLQFVDAPVVSGGFGGMSSGPSTSMGGFAGGSTGPGGGGDDTCPADAAPTGTDCPSVCATCADATCVIDCETSSCNLGSLMCPPGFDCEIRCTGVNGCLVTGITCPPDTRCDLHCKGPAACAGAQLMCGDEGSCTAHCTDDPSACEGLQISCGTNRCSALCTTPATVGPSFDCSQACACSNTCPE